MKLKSIGLEGFKFYKGLTGLFFPDLIHINHMVETEKPLSDQEVAEFDTLFARAYRLGPRLDYFTDLYKVGVEIIKERGTRTDSLVPNRWTFYQALDPKAGETPEWYDDWDELCGFSLFMAYQKSLFGDGLYVSRTKDMHFVNLVLGTARMPGVGVRASFQSVETSFAEWEHEDIKNPWSFTNFNDKF